MAASAYYYYTWRVAHRLVDNTYNHGQSNWNKVKKSSKLDITRKL